MYVSLVFCVCVVASISAQTCNQCTKFNSEACCNSLGFQRCCDLSQRNGSCGAVQSLVSYCRFYCYADGQCPPNQKCCPTSKRVCIPPRFCNRTTQINVETTTTTEIEQTTNSEIISESPIPELPVPELPVSELPPAIRKRQISIEECPQHLPTAVIMTLQIRTCDINEQCESGCCCPLPIQSGCCV